MDNFTIQIGRLVITSPESLGISGGVGEKRFSIRGRLGGVENEMSHLKYIRDQLNSMARMDEHVPFRYSGDSTLDGYVKVNSASIDISKYLLGSFTYSIDMEYIGREGDVNFESRLTGAILENDFSIVNATTEQFHSAPGNHYAYVHNSNPSSNTRTAKDLTSTSASATTTLFLKQSDTLRNSNAQYSVDTEDYYKGACRISMGTHTKKTNAGVITTENSVMCGKDANVWNVGDSLILENGLFKLVLGTSSIQAKINTTIYDETQYASEKEWVFSSGTVATGAQKGNDYAGWRRVQILTNKPELCVVRATTYLNTDKSGRLVVDFALRRGSHFATVIANNFTAGTDVNFGLEAAPAQTPTTSNITSGYLIDGDTTPEDGNRWIVGSSATLSSSTNLINTGIIKRDSSGATFPFFIGYVLYDPNTNNPLGHNDAASLYSQYIDNVNEQQRLIKA